VEVDVESVKISTKTGLTMIVSRHEQTPLEIAQSVVVSVRPEKIQLSLYPTNIPTNCFEGRLINIMYLGTHVNYVVELINGVNLNVLQPNTYGSLPDRNIPIYAWWEKFDCLAISQDVN
jgi:spermidine/putrescine transport system ATP-binding protein